MSSLGQTWRGEYLLSSCCIQELGVWEQLSAHCTPFLLLL